MAKPEPFLNNDGEEQEPPRRWASLADRLNPNRAAFDAKFKEEWKTLDKASKKRIIAEDKKNIRALQRRATTNPLPFATDENDHCETSKTAYGHIVPFLKLIASRLKKEPADLRIYDPYYCAGAVVGHLKELGFKNVHNQPDDFYQTIANDQIPPHDVVVTNPPYSGDHFGRLQNFLASNKKPHLLLVPNHFQVNNTEDYVFLKPMERYHYWTPRGLRPQEDSKKRKHRNLMLGSRNSPFPSKWCVCLKPVASKKRALKTELAEGCTLQKDDNHKDGAKFRQAESPGAEVDDKPKRKKKKRKKNN